MATATTNDIRLEVRQGRAGWRFHVRNATGIVHTSPIPYDTRTDALEAGRAELEEAGVHAWDEWMDGETNHFIDPRTMGMPKVDVDKEAKAAGVDAPSAEAQAEALQKIRDLEARREAATMEAAKARDAAAADSGMGVEAVPGVEKPVSPLKAQRSRAKKTTATNEE